VLCWFWKKERKRGVANSCLMSLCVQRKLCSLHLSREAKNSSHESRSSTAPKCYLQTCAAGIVANLIVHRRLPVKERVFVNNESIRRLRRKVVSPLSRLLDRAVWQLKYEHASTRAWWTGKK
jgi:hypothetical protein